MLDTNFTPSAIIGEEFDTEGCVEQIYGYDDASVCHMIFSNHTWNNDDIIKLTDFYKKQPELIETFLKIQDKCEKDEFAKTLRNVGLLHLPIYSKAIDVSKISTESLSRVYHDPKEYLADGSVTTEELTSFVRHVMKICLVPLFSSKEISKIVKDELDFFNRLMKARSKNEVVVDIESIGRVDSETVNSIRKKLHHQDVCNLRNNIDRSSARFLVAFALHTIRTHCMCSFGVDGELKFFDRHMHKQAVADNDEAKKRMVQKNVKEGKVEKSNKPNFVAVKTEKKEKLEEEDDDFCEIIDPVPKKKVKVEVDKKPTVSKLFLQRDSGERSEILSLEKEVLEEMKTNRYEDWIVFGLRSIIKRNQKLREEIEKVKEVIANKLGEK